MVVIFKEEISRLKQAEWKGYKSLDSFKQIYTSKKNGLIKNKEINKEQANEIYIKLIEKFGHIEDCDGFWIKYANEWSPDPTCGVLLFRIENWSVYKVFPFTSNRNTILIKNYEIANLPYSKEELVGKIDEAVKDYIKVSTGTGYSGEKEWKSIQSMKSDLNYYL